MGRTKNIRKNIKDTKKSAEKKDPVNLELDYFDRMVSHLASNSKKCPTCKNLYKEVETYFELIKEEDHKLSREKKKESKRLIETIIKHLRKEHNLFRQGYYMSRFIPLGTSVGLVVGQMFFGKTLVPIIYGFVAGFLIGLILDITVRNYKRNI